jgi:hypothetical protein
VSGQWKVLVKHAVVTQWPELYKARHIDVDQKVSGRKVVGKGGIVCAGCCRDFLLHGVCRHVVRWDQFRRPHAYGDLPVAAKRGAPTNKEKLAKLRFQGRDEPAGEFPLSAGGDIKNAKTGKKKRKTGKQGKTSNGLGKTGNGKTGKQGKTDDGARLRAMRRERRERKRATRKLIAEHFDALAREPDPDRHDSPGFEVERPKVDPALLEEQRQLANRYWEDFLALELARRTLQMLVETHALYESRQLLVVTNLPEKARSENDAVIKREIRLSVKLKQTGFVHAEASEKQSIADALDEA